MIGQGFYLSVAFGDNSNDFPLTGFDLLDIAYNLFVMSLLCRNHHNGHMLINQRNRSVFHLRCRIALSVDVGDFF